MIEINQEIDNDTSLYQNIYGNSFEYAWAQKSDQGGGYCETLYSDLGNCCNFYYDKRVQEIKLPSEDWEDRSQQKWLQGNWPWIAFLSAAISMVNHVDDEANCQVVQWTKRETIRVNTLQVQLVTQ